MKRFLMLSLIAIVVGCFADFSLANDGFKPLFNGEDVAGWIKRGGDATYSVEDGSIVGKRGDGPNTFLCTEKEYANFILKFDCKFDLPINSGVQIRSQARQDGDREVVYGYQCEIADVEKTSGAVYGESERNRWLDLFQSPGLDAEAAQNAFKLGDWNSYEIQCIGPTVKTWVNGVLCANYFDTTYLKGFIGLQVHGSQNDGQVRWKNLSIKELPDSNWNSLLVKGKDEWIKVQSQQPRILRIPLLKRFAENNTCYKHVKTEDFANLWISPAGEWEMDDEGVVHAHSTKDQTHDGMLKTNESYQDFAARVKFKQVVGNSGLYFRAIEIDQPHWLGGFQDEIDGAATGSLWEVGYLEDKGGRGWVVKNFETAEKVFKADEWNELSIVAIGDRLVTILNGQEIANILDPECRKDGKLAIQLHGHSDTEYYFKDFEVLVVTPEQRELIER